MLYVHNDGKEESMSWEAWSDVCDIRAFGATKAEAIAAHKDVVRQHIARCNRFITGIALGQELECHVDCLGMPLKETVIGNKV